GSTALAAMVVTGGAQQASADLHGAFGAILLGCVTGAVNCNGNNNRQRSTGTSSTRSSGISQAQRQQNRDVQNALNSFGWNVGSADGVLGRNSRSGISQYQAYMGWNPDGTLDDFERNTLIDSWRKFQAGGGNAYPNMMAREGARGMLKTALNPSYPQQFGDGQVTTQQAGFGQQPQPVPQPMPQPVPQQPAFGGQQTGFGQQPLPPAGGQTIDNGGGGLQALAPLPSLGGGAVAPTSVASRCQIVNLKTEAAQGPIQASNLTDPDQALSEKFCDAVSFSIAKSNGRIASTGLPEDQLAQACGQIEQQVKPVFASLGSGAVDGALQQMQSINAALGLTSEANATAYGEICVGMGYRTDDAEMALAGALVLTGANQLPYGELVGHHVREGFGVAAAPAAAQDWYAQSMTALEMGAPPAFEPSSTQERMSVIRGAIQIGGLQSGLVPQLPGIVPTSNQLVPLD
ncbi:MAG: peptidoglycan-binding domain-containing protein, partial [Pseudomonadota bacterium]